jgi:hypothetical protein
MKRCIVPLIFITAFSFAIINVAYTGDFLEELGKIFLRGLTEKLADDYGVRKQPDTDSSDSPNRLNNALKDIILKKGVVKIGIIVEIKNPQLKPEYREHEADRIADVLQARLLKAYASYRDQVKFYERHKLQYLLDEHKFISSGLANQETVKQIGRLAGVDIIFLYAYYLNQNTFKAIDVETGETIFGHTDGSHQAVNVPRQSQEHILINQTYKVPASSYMPIGYNYSAGTVVKISFTSNLDINTWFIEKKELSNFSNKQRFKYFPSASGGRIYNADFQVIIPQNGAYYFILDNRFSIMTDKIVTVKISVVR